MTMLTLLLLQLFIPLALLAWLAFGRHRSKAAWLLLAAAVGAYIAAAALAGLWLVVPLHIPVLLGGLFFAAAWVSWRHVAPTPTPSDRRTWRGWLALASRLAVAVVSGVLLWQAVGGWRPPPAPQVDLAFPLAPGTYLVANGGSTPFINNHVNTLEGERFRPWRGQSYGVDIVRLGAWGLRARGLLPPDPAAYAIFGTPVLAPCDGTVREAVGGRPDLSPPESDRTYLPGNHVLLDCGEAWVLLAHLRAGSVTVRAGARVAVGAELGRVGNSGNTSEPHLHVHAQRPGPAEMPLGGEPLGVTFNGRQLRRNMLVRGRVVP